MAKLTTNDISSILSNPTGAATAINNNNALIETALENTLSRDGTSPNQMGADLDMNSFHILNIPYPSTPTEPARYDQIINLATEAGFTAEAVGATGALMDADFAANGLMTRTAAGTYTNRTLGATDSSLTVTNGNGVSGSPTVAISSANQTLLAGAIQGPASTVDNTLVRYDSTTGKLAQSSPATLGDTGILTITQTAPRVSLVDSSTGFENARLDGDSAIGSAKLSIDPGNVGTAALLTLATRGTDRFHLGTGLYAEGVTGTDEGAGTINATGLFQNGERVWQTVMKPADETIQSDTALGADAALVFAMLANTKYAVRARILFTTGATGDFKYRHSGPASPTSVLIKREHIIGAGTAYAGIALDTVYSAGDIAIAGVAGSGWVSFDGIITNGANAGSFEFQWAQNASEAVNTTVHAGSYLEYRIV